MTDNLVFPERAGIQPCAPPCADGRKRRAAKGSSKSCGSSTRTPPAACIRMISAGLCGRWRYTPSPDGPSPNRTACPGGTGRVTAAPVCCWISGTGRSCMTGLDAGLTGCWAGPARGSGAGFVLRGRTDGDAGYRIQGTRPLFPGRNPLSDAVEKLKQETRRYAKRQLSWFRRMPLAPLYVDEMPDGRALAEEAERIVASVLAYERRTPWIPSSNV